VNNPQDKRALARPSDAPTRRWHAPYPRWDLGWPNYLSWQVERDIVAAARWPRGIAKRCWIKATTWVGHEGSWVLLVPPLVLPPLGFLVGVTLGAYSAMAAYAAAVEVATAIPRLARLVLVGSVRVIDASVRWWRGAATTCPNCRRVANLPAYQCSRALCDVVHRDIRPGRLGALWRRCECGARMPTGVLRATPVLTPVCPACEQRLHDGAGIVPDARIALSGGPAAGKTGLLMDAAVTMTADLGSTAAWEPSDNYGIAWLDNARDYIVRFPATEPKRTADSDLLTLRCATQRRQGYVHFADVDGEYFATYTTNPALRQFGTTRRHLLVIDPTIIPSIRDRIDLSEGSGKPDHGGNHRSATDTSARVELPYHLLVAQLNRMGAQTRRCSLAIVVAKADLVAAWGLAPWGTEPLTNSPAASSHRLREWLCSLDMRILVELAEHDFDDVRYFLVGRGMKSTDPVAPFAWLLSRHLKGAAMP